MIRYKGQWRYIKDVKDGTIGENMTDYKRYQSTHVGIKSVEATLIPSAGVDNNVSNKLKIIKYISQKGYRVVETKDKGFGRIELVFDGMAEANRCLDDKEGKDKKVVDFNIPRNNVLCKGAVVGWDTKVSLEDFVEALQEKRIPKIERLRRRFYGKDQKKVIETLSSGIVIMWEDSNLPDNVKLYDGLIRLRVRLFIPAVVQCFKCYRYGHFKVHCKNQEKCKVCGEGFHGRCDRVAKYINCGEKYMANDRRCEVYRYNSLLKRTMVLNRVNVREAKILLESERRGIVERDRNEEVEERRLGEERNREREREMNREPWIRVIKSYAKVAGRSSRVRQEKRDEEIKEKEEKELEIRKIIKEVVAEELKNLGTDFRNLWRKIDDQYKQMIEEFKEVVRKCRGDDSINREGKRLENRVGNRTNEEKGEGDRKLYAETSNDIRNLIEGE